MSDRQEIVTGFAAIPNWMIRDSSVSASAIAVYGALASHSGPGGIHPSQKLLAQEARCSERQVRYALAELETLGVVERVRRKDSRGRASNGYTLHPNGRLGVDEEPAEVAAPPAATAEVAAHGAGGYGTERQITPLIEEEPMKKNPSIVSPRFEAFWAVYPRRAGKQAAAAKWEQLAKKGVDLQAVLDGARRFASDPNLPDPQFIPHPITWLNQGRWEDDPLPPRDGVRLSPADRARATIALGAEQQAVTA